MYTAIAHNSETRIVLFSEYCLQFGTLGPKRRLYLKFWSILRDENVESVLLLLLHVKNCEPLLLLILYHNKFEEFVLAF